MTIWAWVSFGFLLALIGVSDWSIKRKLKRARMEIEFVREVLDQRKRARECERQALALICAVREVLEQPGEAGEKLAKRIHWALGDRICACVGWLKPGQSCECPTPEEPQP